MEFKWKRFFELLVGVILSFADPITDILTLVEYYRAEHFKWFATGLVFVLLPCLCYVGVYLAKSEPDSEKCVTEVWLDMLFCACHPFPPAFMKLEELLVYLKKMRRVDAMNSNSNAEAGDIQSEIHLYLFLESLLESAPQFVIQLYVINVQEEAATMIQIISLPVSLLSVAWAFATVDDALLRMNNNDRNGDTLQVNYKFFLFATQVLLLSGRLVAICYFTVSFQWLVMPVLVYHTCLLAIGDTVWHCIKSGKCEVGGSFVFFVFVACVFNSLRDDKVIRSAGESRKYMRRRQLICNVLFILENLFIVLLYYFTQPKNWYSLPVTVSVCVQSVLGGVIRVKLYHFLYRDLNEEIVVAQ